MSDKTTAYERGKRAYHDGAAVSVIPSDMSLEDYEDYRKGWDMAWQEEIAERSCVVAHYCADDASA